MQKVVIEKPYEFVPPFRGTFWPSLVQRLHLNDWYTRRFYGVTGYECRGAEHLRDSLDRGYGIMLTPNHCRPGDPIILGFLMREVKTHMFGMASWHLFNQDWFTGWALRRVGAFSVNREGNDRQSLDTAIDILVSTNRPLVVFPEGASTRTNDRLHALLDGVAFIARTAARRRQKQNPDSRVVVHPTAIKYFFQGEIQRAVVPVLEEIERRLYLRHIGTLPLLARIERIAECLVLLKEMDYFGSPRTGRLQQRQEGLIRQLLRPLEEEWFGGEQSDAEGVVPRVKALRMKIVPGLIDGNLPPEEKERRRLQLADIYLSQQISCYPYHYLADLPSIDRVLETVERLEEDLTDTVRVHGHLKAVIQVAPAIEVDPQGRRDRSGQGDPLMRQIGSGITTMLDRLALESPLIDPAMRADVEI